MLEIEAKIKIDSIQKTELELKNYGAEYLGESAQSDVYYNAPHRDFAKTDEALRIRDDGKNIEVTYKGAKIKDSSAKAREEINIRVDSKEDFEKILYRLGFVKSGEVSKHRREYSFLATTVALDRVDKLGEFIEIEVLSEDKTDALEKIEAVVKKLKITGEPTTTSYLEMVLEKN